MKVMQKPVLESLKDELLPVLLETEEETYTVYIHAYGTYHQFHASRILLKNQESSQVDQLIAFNKYVATLIHSWDEKASELFGGPYSFELALTLCQHPSNAWLVNGLHEALEINSKKQMQP
ncbi:hypothetical protein [Vibrio astriarenae]|uniref:hypothetical protein n=1 Tax=Vibrio astriarenae TaxID=1481923 RepID=UPI003736BF85